MADDGELAWGTRRSETDVFTDDVGDFLACELPDHPDLIDDLREVAGKFAADNATRGDLKIVARAMRELRYAFKVFKPYRLCRKVSVFGSARTPADDPEYQAAVAFSRAMAESGWMSVTGAGPGIMAAGNKGAGRDMAFGLNIMLPFEAAANEFIADDPKLIHFKYFFTRKLLFVKEVHAIAVFAGGFGTLDELFEALTLVQTGKRDLMPIVCVDAPGQTFFGGMQRFIKEELLARGTISPEDLDLYRVTDSVDEAVGEVLHFYSVYHSMRYVRDRLVLRFCAEIGDDLLSRLNDEFADICAKGSIERATADPVEQDDPHLADLPRLALHFDRQQIGRLRQLVDAVNDELG
ncbi:MAG: TIGR00730 family Rossman fold protein [Planctomycetota bacterium]